LGCLRANINPTDSEKVLEFAQKAVIDYRKDRVFLEAEDVTDALHTDEIDRFSAPLSAIVPIRRLVNNLVRKLAEGRDLVVEGRDMTTVVFPGAEYRFYLDASVESRARRRFDQGVSRLSLEEIGKTIAERDAIDKNKIEGSLKIAPGVQYIDTSGLTINEVYDTLVERIKQENKA
jgi:cytidylate kinase